MSLLESHFIVKHVVHRYRLMRYHFLIFVDRLRNVDLTEAVSVDKLKLNPNESHMYYASSPALKRVLRQLKITALDQIIDIGCGKGRALYYMSKFPFEKIAGVDISPYLTDICKKNMEKLNILNCEIYNMDAGMFEEYDSFNYVYFYNPFSDEILTKCLANIEKSLSRRPRKLIIIYHNPVYAEVIPLHGFKLVSKLHFDRFYIYVSK